MATDDEAVQMVVIDGVRYRSDDAPKRTKDEPVETSAEEKPARTKMRKPRTASTK